MNDIESILIAEFREYLAFNMLEQLTCYSATDEFQALSHDLAYFLDCPPADAANLLLPVSVGLRDVIKHEIPRLIQLEVCRAA